ncbi:MAG TPA: hypothetical protein ENK99_05270 [Campylobacterales bacterium]|nr:hypothetical protein [Campylobacterales bacterium]
MTGHSSGDLLRLPAIRTSVIIPLQNFRVELGLRAAVLLFCAFGTTESHFSLYPRRFAPYEIKKFDIKTVLVCGGGAKNSYLMESLQSQFEDIVIDTTDSYGVSGDDIEAMIFAWFAYKRLCHEPIKLKTVTGAKKNTILGGIYATD